MNEATFMLLLEVAQASAEDLVISVTKDGLYKVAIGTFNYQFFSAFNTQNIASFVVYYCKYRGDNARG